jgi:uncharacterized membrane protein YoaK (UPF0700 family)
MNAFLADVRDTVAPARGSKDGLLPPLLVGLTAVTGLVDAFSYLVLGHVFVANMTGNVVFLAFALAGTGGFSALASLVAIACFAAGALATGRLGRELTHSRERLLGVTAAVQAALLAAAVIMAALTARPVPTGLQYALIVVLAAAMGAQNATARKLAVPDLTTTVLTLTITGIAADSPLAGATGAKAARRLISVAAMLLGALVGALLVVHVRIVFPLVIALLILVAVALTAVARSRSRGGVLYASRCAFVRRNDRSAGQPVPGDPRRPARPRTARGPALQWRRWPGRPV